MFRSERRRVGGGAGDDVDQRIPDGAKERSSVGGVGARGKAGDAVPARLRHGIREDAFRGAVGIVRDGELVEADELGCKMEEQVGLSLVGVEIGRIGDERLPDGRRELVGVPRADLEAAKVGEPDLVDGDADRGVVAEVGIHEEQSPPAGGGRPVGDLAQRGDERFVPEREGARPFGGVTGGDGDGERREQGNAGAGGGEHAGGFREQGVRAGRQVRAVLLGRAEGQQEQAAAAFAEGGNLGPRQVLEKNRGAPGEMGDAVESGGGEHGRAKIPHFACRTPGTFDHARLVTAETFWNVRGTPMSASKPVSFGALWNMNFGFLGIQFGWGLQMANMSAIYEFLGANADEIPLLWLAAPLTGILVQPIIGHMSDLTWTRLGRRRPYFLGGTILAVLGLTLMPHSPTVWAAALVLWMMDLGINASMEPFRAFVADLVPPEQRAQGYAMQSLFIGMGAVLGSALPWVLTNGFHVPTDAAGGGIADSVRYAFYLGAAAYAGAILWTVITTRETPPPDVAAFRRASAGRFGPGAQVRELLGLLRVMPRTMRQLAWVQAFTWFGLFCMWIYFAPAVARSVFGATDPQSAEFAAGVEWAGVCFAVYNGVCLVFSFALIALARRYEARWIHFACLLSGALGLASVAMITNPHVLLLSMVGVGVAWASIVSMPYAMLSHALPADKMGVYMGVFNFFISGPQIVASLGLGWVMAHVLGNDRMLAILLGAASLAVAAMLTPRVGRAAAPA